MARNDDIVAILHPIQQLVEARFGLGEIDRHHEGAFMTRKLDILSLMRRGDRKNIRYSQKTPVKRIDRH